MWDMITGETFQANSSHDESICVTIRREKTVPIDFCIFLRLWGLSIDTGSSSPRIFCWSVVAFWSTMSTSGKSDVCMYNMYAWINEWIIIGRVIRFAGMNSRYDWNHQRSPGLWSSSVWHGSRAYRNLMLLIQNGLGRGCLSNGVGQYLRLVKILP